MLTAQTVLAAANALLDAFAANDRDAYFAHFAPDATFWFHALDRVLPSRAAYEAEFDAWLALGFHVLSFRSYEQSVRLYGDTALFMHESLTTARMAGAETTMRERESILLRDFGQGRILAVHEHLSLA